VALHEKHACGAMECERAEMSDDSPVNLHRIIEPCRRDPEEDESQHQLQLSAFLLQKPKKFRVAQSDNATNLELLLQVKEIRGVFPRSRARPSDLMGKRRCWCWWSEKQYFPSWWLREERVLAKVFPLF